MEQTVNRISFYHQLGLQQKEILGMLEKIDNIVISERTLRRILARCGLFRRKNYTDVCLLTHFIENEIQRHGQLHGYRWMHLRCLQNNFIVTQESVREILKIVDPFGVELRKRKRLRRRQYYNKGPNYLWHLDCYDKLKPFGICINGCIDGFSRYILWLKAGNNSSDPALIGYNYLEVIKDLRGCPRTVRTDMGTENVIVEELQLYLRHDYNELQNCLPPFLYGTSPANQRIESWWSILRKHHSQFWLNLFHGLKDAGLFDGSFLDQNLIQFCFLEIIQKELDEVILEWNLHRIRASKNSISPTGRPFVMYNHPETCNTRDYLHYVVPDNLCHRLCQKPLNQPCDISLCELSLIIMEEENWSKAKDPYAAIDLYILLKRKISSILQ